MIKTADLSAVVFLLEEKNAALGDSGTLRFRNREVIAGRLLKEARL